MQITNAFILLYTYVFLYSGLVFREYKDPLKKRKWKPINHPVIPDKEEICTSKEVSFYGNLLIDENCRKIGINDLFSVAMGLQIVRKRTVKQCIKSEVSLRS